MKERHPVAEGDDEIMPPDATAHLWSQWQSCQRQWQQY